MIVAALLAGAILQDEPSVELTYRALFSKEFAGQRDEVVSRAVKVIERRFEVRGIKARVSADGESIVVRLRADAAKDGRALIGVVGYLALKEVAGKDVHDTFTQDGVVPDGYEKYAAPKDATKEEGDWLLVCKEAGLTGADIATADHELDPRLRRWKINITMTEAGARRFDELAARCFSKTPKGRVAIILDGKVMSAPAVQAEKFGGRAEITGNFSEEEAKNLAIAFRSGELPVSLGRVVDGKPEPGVPESEREVAPKK